MVSGTTGNAFMDWFSQWGQVVYFFAQILFWAAIAAAALIYALQYRRLVGFKVGGGEAAAATDETPVEVFVE